MKIQKKAHRKINTMISGRWTAYAAAGAASALTCPNSVEAEIHYSGHVHIELTGNAQASLPLSNGASLVFKNSHGTDTFFQFFTFVMKGVISGSARSYFPNGRRHLLSNLPSRENVSVGEFGTVIGPGYGVLFTFWSDGQFAAPASGFVGFRFDTGKGTQYGWARIKTKDIDSHTHDLIKDYAWGDPGDVILTGQTHSSESANANSVAGSLGLLAFGAQGLDAWRMQRTHESN